MADMKKWCEHPKFERIGVTKDGIYSETEEKCTKCGHVREIGKEWKNGRRRKK